MLKKLIDIIKYSQIDPMTDVMVYLVILLIFAGMMAGLFAWVIFA